MSGEGKVESGEEKVESGEGRVESWAEMKHCIMT